MEKAYKILHIPTGKYLAKYVGGYRHKWKLETKGKTWSCKLSSLIKGGVVIDDKLIPESEFRFVELTPTDREGLIEKIKTLYNNKDYIYDTKTINDILGIINNEI